jgi:hypothetical protein
MSEANTEKGYELATLEEAEEFAKKRNYVYTVPWNGVAHSVNQQWKVTIKDEPRDN